MMSNGGKAVATAVADLRTDVAVALILRLNPTRPPTARRCLPQPADAQAGAPFGGRCGSVGGGAGDGGLGSVRMSAACRPFDFVQRMHNTRPMPTIHRRPSMTIRVNVPDHRPAHVHVVLTDRRDALV